MLLLKSFMTSLKGLCTILFLTFSLQEAIASVPFSSHALNTPYTQSAESYLAAARTQTGVLQKASELMAAGSLIEAGQWQAGEKILHTLPALPPELMNERNLLQAKIFLMQEKPTNAIQSLSGIQALDRMSLYHQVQYHEMLATAYRASGNRIQALHERITLDKLLPDEGYRINNRRALWLMLTLLPESELHALALESSKESELGGWVQLALIARNRSDAQAIVSSLEQWKARYSNHPGNTLLPSTIARIEPYLFAAPQKIALLLPLSGKLSGPARAVEEGFMQAYQADNRSLTLGIRVYDTDKASALSQYRQAIADGADYVVGPLGKADVASIAAIEHPVPTILLNDINTKVQPNAYQFGLSPTNEARQVAARAHKNGHHRALVITPSNPWGDEVLAAFTNQWRASGGEIVDGLRYDGFADVGHAVKNLLHAVESKRPPRQHSKLAKPASSLRRQDFDMIFLVAYPSKARQIMPMLRYYYAGDVPVYATSAVYAGSADPQKDRDLDGIIFCDMPWVFTHQMGQKNWPEQWNSYNRLFALGQDSFALVERLNQLLLFPAMGANESSGVLYLNANQQIARILSFGKMQKGLAVQLS